ncbi:MAG: DKNYY domain-containing protein [Pseudomonadota bacterium]
MQKAATSLIKLSAIFIGTFVGIPLALLILLNTGRPMLERIPATTCSVEWLDQELNRTTGSFNFCPIDFGAVRTLDKEEYVELDGHVYRMRKSETNNFGGNCMVGVACFPHISWPHVWKTVQLIELPGPVDFSKLHAFLGGEYLSDGKAQYYQWYRIQDTDPPVNMSQLQRFEHTSYATDGRWVLHDNRVLNADPKSFETIQKLSIGGPDDETWSAFGRTKTNVYFKGQAIVGADPGSFKVIKYFELKKGEHATGHYRSVAFDKAHVWEEGSHEMTATDASRDYLLKLHADAIAAELELSKHLK